MQYEFTDEDNVLVIKVSGRVLANERLLTKRELTSRLQKPNPNVIVDLSGVKGQGGPSFLGILNFLRMEVHMLGGKIKFCALPSDLLHSFQENRLRDIFQIEQTMIQAKRSLKNENYEKKH